MNERWLRAYTLIDSRAYWALVRLDAILKHPPADMPPMAVEWIEETAKLLREGVEEAHRLASPEGGSS